MKKNKFIFSLSLILGVALSTCVLASTETEIKDVTSAYRNYKEINLPKILVPTVVEIPFTETSLERFEFQVLDKTAGNFEPSLLLLQKEVNPIRSINIRDLNSNSQTLSDNIALYDNDESSYVELPIIDDKISSVDITINSKEIINTDFILLLLDNHVALPNTVSIFAGTDQNLKTVLATKKVDSQSIYFPKTSATRFVIRLTYGQPLRITELRFGGYGNRSKSYKLRFLAQPDHEYKVYFDPDRRVNVRVGEAGNLSDNRDVLVLSGSKTLINPSYKIADTDGDNVPDVLDNCVSVSNIDQVDVNGNGRGDVCDDFDKDGIINSVDNCPNLPNYNQQDTDGDKIGDVCDSEESRITEKYTWLPWVGIGLAAIVVIILFIFTALSMRKKTDLPTLN